MTAQVQDCYGKSYLVQWKEVSQARYQEMMGVLPPVAFASSGFMVGEPWTHRYVEGREYAAFCGFKTIAGKFYECLAPLTVAEFNCLRIEDILAEVQP